MGKVNYVVGLGNPGSSYSLTRHNVGFMLLDALADNFCFSCFSRKFGGLIATGYINGNEVVLFKPYSYMNNSGLPLLKLFSFYKINIDNVLVVHDELDIPFGSLRIKRGGGNAGHNGLKSIDKHISNNYWRLRIGIGRSLEISTADYVLSKFKKDEPIAELLEKITEHFALIFTDDKNLILQKVLQKS